MWVDPEVVMRTQHRDRVREAERQRLAARARAARTGRALADHSRRLREAAGFGLIRTGLRLLDNGRA
jgi:hypothetical protein